MEALTPSLSGSDPGGQQVRARGGGVLEPCWSRAGASDPALPVVNTWKHTGG